MESTLLTAIALPFLGIPLLAILGPRLGRHAGWVALPIAAVSFGLILSLALGNEAFGRRLVEVPWIPSLGIGLQFMVDGLSLFFGLVVAGMGVLVILYACSYLDDHYEFHGRFYASLLFFMGAMLGTVFSDNLMLLFVFWELTGISSFLLIGFLNRSAVSRAGARMALLTTGLTGLVLLAGIVLTGHAAGTLRLSEMMSGAVPGGDAFLFNAAFVLVAIGAFGKSAQVPFHFWLPNAMAAPTPVSAYLHSATMVKLGVFLLARVFPVFREAEVWAPLLVTVGFLTLAAGAWMALSSTDLKAILAYSTVSQLGFLIGFYGIGSMDGVHYDLMHIANHVFYKGCLFMVAGIIDHSTGTRDIRELGGLARRTPALALIALIGAATMAGVPGTIGFISKEYMLKEKFDYWSAGDFLNWYPLAMVVLATVLKVAFCVRLWWGVFGGREPRQIAENFHAPGFWILLPPGVLAAACLLFGLFPGAMTPALEGLAVAGLHLPDVEQLSLWHGVTREFLLSAAMVAAGAGLFGLLAWVKWRWAVIPAWARFDVGFERGVEALPALGKKVNWLLRADRPLDYLPIILGFTVLAVGAALGFGGGVDRLVVLLATTGVDPLRAFVGVLVTLSVILVMVLGRWTAQLVALSIVGFLITFLFVLFRAPDLAMTQILVEAATLILILLLLSRFPRSAEVGESRKTHGTPRQIMNACIAGGVGLVAAVLTLLVSAGRHPEPVGAYFLENTVPAAMGSNAVNTILVDFRGFDTLLEITVLLVAMLGALGLLTRNRRQPGQVGPAARLPGEAGLSEDTVVAVASRKEGGP